MYIQPNTTIKFLQNIPFDADYNDTVYFYPSEGQAGQAEYFDSFTKYTINENYYQRVNKGELKVQLPYSTGVQYESTAEKLYDCNYMMFRNTNFGNKWFYAFIKNVEWVNNETAKITYELDVMQTWFFDYDLEQCFIEREHSATDEIGDNLVPENLDMGYEMVTRDTVEYYSVKYNPHPTTRDEALNSWVICMLVSKPWDGSFAMDLPEKGSNQSPIVKTLQTYYFYLGQLDGVPNYSQNDLLVDGTVLYEFINPVQPTSHSFEDIYKLYINSQNNLTPDDVILIYLAPCFTTPFIKVPFLTPAYSGGQPVLPNLSISLPQTLGTSENNYTPVNKKVFTYPYVQLVGSNQQGTLSTYKFEYFKENNGQRSARFGIRGISLNNPSILCYPINYFPATASQNTPGYDYSISCNDFPQLAIPGDAFKAWWAQNKSSITTSTAFGVLSGIITTAIGAGLVGASAETGGMTAMMGKAMIGQGLTSVAKEATGVVAKRNDASHLSNSVSNLSNATYILANQDAIGIRFHTKTITAPQAKIIDDYFTMFGYACHEVKTPNRHARPHWTYTQTVGCTIKARCPGDDQKKICQIYDKGIRFWSHDTNTEIGKYYNANGTPIDNSPTAG